MVVRNELLFFRQRDGPYIPTLRLLHKCEWTSVSCLVWNLWRGRLKWTPPPPSLSFPSPLDPTLLPQLQVDKGAIKFVLSGANIMCPGLTSPGARMDVSIPADTVIVSLPVWLYSYQVWIQSVLLYTQLCPQLSLALCCTSSRYGVCRNVGIATYSAVVE